MNSLIPKLTQNGSIIGLNVKPETMKFPKDNIKANLCNSRLGKDFLYMIPKERFINEKIDKLNIKIKKLCSWKDSVRRMKDKPQAGRNFCKCISDKGLVCRIYIKKTPQNSIIR